MELSLIEAATILDVSPRTLRARLARGDVLGTKRGGRWFVARDALPWSPAQRRRAQARADEIRAAVERALPSRSARRRGERRRSVADLEGFRLGAAVLRELESGSEGQAGRAEAREALRAGLLALCEGAHAFQPDEKLACFRRARAGVSRAVAALLLASAGAPEEPELGWVVELEGGLLASLGGLMRWTEKLGRRGA